jgi:hypothetical protein
MLYAIIQSGGGNVPLASGMVTAAMLSDGYFLNIKGNLWKKL